jgi:hypothetical protein
MSAGHSHAIPPRPALLNLAGVEPRRRVQTMRLEGPGAARFTDCPLLPGISLALLQKLLQPVLVLTAQKKSTVRKCSCERRHQSLAGGWNRRRQVPAFPNAACFDGKSSATAMPPPVSQRRRQNDHCGRPLRTCYRRAHFPGPR